jgi:hypothetical protein
MNGWRGQPTPPGLAHEMRRPSRGTIVGGVPSPSWLSLGRRSADDPLHRMGLQGPERKKGHQFQGQRMHDKGRGPDVEAARRIIALWDISYRNNCWLLSPATKAAVLQEQMIVSLAPWPLAVVQIKLPCPDRDQDCSVGLQLTYLGIFLVVKTRSTLTRDDSDGRRPPRRAEHLQECKLAYTVRLYIELAPRTRDGHLDIFIHLFLCTRHIP